jgi:superfamily I DNA/RNA helicase
MNPRGSLKVSHDHYRKAWALRHPNLGTDFLLVDEAQDSDGLTQALVKDQIERGTQVITVGDTNQAIYGWRGSESAMEAFGGTRVYLTQSFRFGNAIAAEANAWLTMLDARMRIKGTPTIRSVVGPVETIADAVLCRTNARAVETLIEHHEAGIPARVEGGGNDVRQLAQAAKQFKETGRTWHPDLVAFGSWAQVQDFVEQDHAGADLATAVKLIDRWGENAIIDALDKQADADRARVVVSTAHKAKGLEWGVVRVATDFPAPKPDDDAKEFDLSREDMMLAYVTVTRAKNHLDNEGLAWVHQAVRTPAKAAA